MTAILIDGSNIAYRFGYVHRFLTATDGRKTGVAYGLTGLLLRLKRRYPDARFVVVWDGFQRHKSWRHQIYADYKGNRKGEKPQELIEAVGQIPMVDRMLAKIGVPTIRVDEIEADDLIGILATASRAKGWDVVIYSSDKDYLQLMRHGIKLIRDTDKDHRLAIETPLSVFREFRCDPKDLLKVRALAGDKSDNIPGIEAGVGPVKASKLIAAGFDFKMSPIASRNYRLMKLVTEIDFPHFSDEAREKLRPQIEAVMEVLETGSRLVAVAEIAEFFSDLSMVEAVGHRHELSTIMKLDT
jgi:DNA polymerase I